MGIPCFGFLFLLSAYPCVGILEITRIWSLLEPQFSPLYSGDNNNTYLIISGTVSMKYSAQSLSAVSVGQMWVVSDNKLPSLPC